MASTTQELVVGKIIPRFKNLVEAFKTKIRSGSDEEIDAFLQSNLVNLLDQSESLIEACESYFSELEINLRETQASKKPSNRSWDSARKALSDPEELEDGDKDIYGEEVDESEEPVQNEKNQVKILNAEKDKLIKYAKEFMSVQINQKGRSQKHSLSLLVLAICNKYDGLSYDLVKAFIEQNKEKMMEGVKRK